ncbi:hypothetical protein CERZMDRAFT_81240 [Cercospora zeae-maydis SCOH1-5]|uniref:Uncharacterized protein n=1 Tax=Cercospora zeae-maydis SCOH1-5 TaxID=717836 RepID=A0A6A6FVN1_9PEZI|nr:hypothetical protein CERZMDRAFT_81240 [Cercospora zeae-maydis SCOH1-5]
MCGGCWSPASVSGPTCWLYPNPVAQAYGKDLSIERIKLTKDMQILLLEYCQSVDLDGTYVQDRSDDLSKSKGGRSLSMSPSGAKENQNTLCLRSPRRRKSRHHSGSLQPYWSRVLPSSIQQFPQSIPATIDSAASEGPQDQQVARPTDTMVSSSPSTVDVTDYIQDHKDDTQSSVHEERIRE